MKGNSALGGGIGGGSTGAMGQLPPYSGNYGGSAPVQNTVVTITVVNNCK